jgi:hypothetical protein
MIEFLLGIHKRDIVIVLSLLTFLVITALTLDYAVSLKGCLVSIQNSVTNKSEITSISAIVNDNISVATNLTIMFAILVSIGAILSLIYFVARVFLHKWGFESQTFGPAGTTTTVTDYLPNDKYDSYGIDDFGLGDGDYRI